LNSGFLHEIVQSVLTPGGGPLLPPPTRRLYSILDLPSDEPKREAPSPAKRRHGASRSRIEQLLMVVREGGPLEGVVTKTSVLRALQARGINHAINRVGHGSGHSPV
jgi:hypothetical protein